MKYISPLVLSTHSHFFCFSFSFCLILFALQSASCSVLEASQQIIFNRLPGEAARQFHISRQYCALTSRAHRRDFKRLAHLEYCAIYGAPANPHDDIPCTHTRHKIAAPPPQRRQHWHLSGPQHSTRTTCSTTHGSQLYERVIYWAALDRGALRHPCPPLDFPLSQGQPILLRRGCGWARRAQCVAAAAGDRQSAANPVTSERGGAHGRPLHVLPLLRTR